MDGQAQAIAATSTGRDRWGLPVALFGVVGVVTVVGILSYARHMWFYLDEWDFLATRTAGDLDDLLRPHNEHWTTLPILAFRGLWQVFGLRTYVPYLLLDVLLHVTLAALLLVLLKRCGVRPWLAVAVASAFLLFGSGYQNLAQAFQITFVGSLVFGFVHLLCADHPGSWSRDDWLGLLAGAAGLMCSGIAVPMVVLVGVAMFLRRGARIALAHTVPLALAYAWWYVAFGRRTTGPPGDYLSAAGAVPRFMASGVVAAFQHLGQVAVASALLGVVLVVGSALAWRGPFRPGAVPRATAIPIACVVGLMAFLAMTGFGRVAVFGDSSAGVSRYLHIDVALLTVPLGVAAEAIVRRQKVMLVPLIVLFLVGIPGNVSELAEREDNILVLVQREKGYLLWTAHAGADRGIPADFHPDEKYAQPVTLGWLLGALADGKVPSPGGHPGELTGIRDAESMLARAAAVPVTSPATGAQGPAGARP